MLRPRSVSEDVMRLLGPLAGPFPGIDAAAQSLGMGEALLLELFRPTGGSGFLGSGTVEDDFLVLIQFLKFFFQLLQMDGTFQMHFAALFFVIVSADENGLAVLHLGSGFFRGDAWGFHAPYLLFRMFGSMPSM
jgi:hypothetical protein